MGVSIPHFNHVDGKRVGVVLTKENKNGAALDENQILYQQSLHVYAFVRIFTDLHLSIRLYVTKLENTEYIRITSVGKGSPASEKCMKEAESLNRGSSSDSVNSEGHDSSSK